MERPSRNDIRNQMSLSFALGGKNQKSNAPLYEASAGRCPLARTAVLLSSFSKAFLVRLRTGISDGPPAVGQSALPVYRASSWVYYTLYRLEAETTKST